MCRAEPKGLTSSVSGGSAADLTEASSLPVSDFRMPAFLSQRRLGFASALAAMLAVFNGCKTAGPSTSTIAAPKTTESCATSPSAIRIELAQTNSPRLQEMMEKERHLLEELIARYWSLGLDRYVFTDYVLLDRQRSHSRAPLTISIRHSDDPDGLLWVFLHEQIHLFLGAPGRRGETLRCIQELAAKYPKLRVDLGEGGGKVSDDEARNTHAMYQHVLVEWLTLRGLIHFLGEDRARSLVRDSIAKRLYYYGIDQFMLDHELEIGDLLRS